MARVEEIEDARIAVATVLDTINVAITALITRRPEWFTGVARGDVDWSLGTLATMKPMLDSNLLRLLAVAQDKRSPDRPDVSTVSEAGGPKGYVVEAWAGFVVMNGTPSAIVERLNQDIVRVLSDHASPPSSMLEARLRRSLFHAAQAQSFHCVERPSKSAS